MHIATFGWLKHKRHSSEKVHMLMVCSTQVLCPQNLFLTKSQRYKGRRPMSRYADIRHLCFWHRLIVCYWHAMIRNDVNKTSTSVELLAINILCYMS